MSASTFLFGPLTSVEIRRVTARRWVQWARLGSAGLGIAVCLTVAFVVWVSSQANLDSSPGPLIRAALLIMSACTLLAALLISPALLAGALAGEKDHGTLGMLLIARVSSWEIIAGRLLPRLWQVAFLTIGILTPLAYLAGLNNMGLWRFMLLVAVIGSSAWGAGGLALLASALVRRSRDALMAVFAAYVAGLALITAGPRIFPGMGWEYVNLANPFQALAALCLDFRSGPALATIAAWCVLGAVSALVAAWQLRPAYVRQLSGAAQSRRARRQARWSTIGNWPMLWKELFVERTAALGRVGQWLTWMLISVLLAGSLGSAAVIVGVEGLGWGTQAEADAARWVLSEIVVNTAIPLSWLVQWAIGLRAAVSISSERQRETWDSLLTSPLDGAEIVFGKFGGSLYALRWLVASVLVSWIAALSFGEFSVSDFAYVLISTLTGVAFVAAVGVQISLINTGAARSMAFTLGIWLAMALLSFAAAGVATVLLFLFGFLLLALLGLVLYGLGVTASAQPPVMPNVTFGVIFMAVRALMYVTATVSLVGWLGRSFDRLAGRGWQRAAPEMPVWVTSQGRIVAMTPEGPVERDDAAPMTAPLAAPAAE